MRVEQVPVPPSPEQPPLAPYDPPEPAPQAAAWEQALRVIGGAASGDIRIMRTVQRRATRHRC